MEYAKDDMFKITYNTKLNRLQMGQPTIGRKLIKKIKSHKIIAILIIAIAGLSIINTIMVYNFLQTLLKI